MQAKQTDLYELTRKANELTCETEEIARLLKTRLGPDHELVCTANMMHQSLESLTQELRSYCTYANLNETEISEDT